ncbi:PIN domain-containing protein [Stenotrophomonas sp. JAI102]|uniref:PIN domain-containing protein n=1 Tax=Stenotrophomonas sp. JAI102 TaxID=2723077 RepID=UPI0015CAC647|nr:PIN domain-containing protein [Stenotrophomonas sp. JAI102]NYF35358.1 putative nucleic acid-binding protein [Stenotrophomonas sp. JAI102]
MHVFIDTNILLNFFHFTKEEIDALSNIFASHEHGAATVHLTEQVCNEFSRNRENKIKDALKKFKDVKFAAQLPAFMKQYEEYEQIRQKSMELQELAKSISNKVDSDVLESGLLTDALIKEIFAKSNPIPTTPELFAKAQMRSALGNPPGKNGSMGDAVNWIALLGAVPGGQNLHVISEDGDYYSTLDETRPHPFLAKEWSDTMHGKLLVYRTLSSFLKEHFDGVAFSYDKDKEALIDSLAESGSFAVTHNLIAKLEQFGYFSLKEVQRILAAAVANNQFGWIASDDDVFTFLRRVAVPRIGALTDPEQIELLQGMLGAKAAQKDG